MFHKPKIHSLDSLHEGLVERFVFKATNEMMQSFVEISGDVNPLHTDSNYATSRGFDGVVVYGGILVAQISRMVGKHTGTVTRAKSFALDCLRDEEKCCEQ